MNFLFCGCATQPQTTALAPVPKLTAPILAVDLPTPGPQVSGEVVAELDAQKITRTDLDSLLYKTYGLQMVFDLVELDLAKNTLAAQLNPNSKPGEKLPDVTLPQSVIDRERQIVFSQMFPDAQPGDYENLFNQFLAKEKMKREEFEMRAIETSAYLRKIIEPIVIGKFSDDALHRGYEIMYGANRQIQDITLDNQRDATIAHDRVTRGGEPFDKVAREMSTDKNHRDTGGLWEPFSANTKDVPQVIIDAAFSKDVGTVSDILTDGTSWHIVKVLTVIEPKLAKFEDVKADVRKQMEEKLIEKNMKALRQQLQGMAQRRIKFDDPILKAQWDKILASQQPKSTDRDAVLHQVGPVKNP